MRSLSLSHLEPSGPVQACTEIALPLPFYPFQILCGSDCCVYSNTEKVITFSVHTPHKSTVFPLRLANITFCYKIAPQTGQRIQNHAAVILHKHNISCIYVKSCKVTCMCIYYICLMCMYREGRIFQAGYPVLLDPEDVGTILLRNVGKYSPNDTASRPRRLQSYAKTEGSLEFLFV
jgi:hypothetical protein